MSVRFRRYELRTTNVDGARAFYGAVLGHTGDTITPLPAAAAARGAPSHWLGWLGPLDPATTAQRWMGEGAMQLGPQPIFRDPIGATVALTDAATTSSAGVVWHLLHTTSVPRAQSTYVAPFGWSEMGTLALPPPFGAQHTFAFAPGEPAALAVTDVSARPSVHTHWLFFFGVPVLDRALEAVRDGGGEAFDVVRGPGDRRAVMCHDPAGAAFGLME